VIIILQATAKHREFSEPINMIIILDEYHKTSVLIWLYFSGPVLNCQLRF